jgi:hypothetical protein
MSALRRFALATAVLLSAQVPSLAGARSAPLRDHFVPVFNGPVAGQEQEYNRWYDQEHARDVVSIPGFVSAQRFARSPVQLRPNAGDSPPYVVLYHIRTRDLASVFAEVNRRAMDGQTRMSKSLAHGGGMNITFLRTDATRTRAIDPSRLYLHVVMADSDAGQEQSLDRWYARHHAPDMAKLPGFSSYELGTFMSTMSTQMIPDAHAPHHIALFRIDTDDLPATIAVFRQTAPHVTPDPVMHNLCGYTYQAIGTVISGATERRKRRGRPGSSS